eukprot:CAMPEP_0185599582 /NCGR_PEP_ID=MMETSP0434-20130131/82806_1 /TAXON_ID=626734 ORGANISM="Favella taraikaensis, Strain Fe Narragansett Bay" /NCGR_SAMPLE_ID=MMETSP0434 /ASSEMBLY_ACC=CAM_ASM_000379 /LENGTH=213 /DNA_ID=CAMNT_0028229041 /DNA_START=610 /DNA_END=1253 /DNA_ORIENTATION=-
MTLSSDVSPTVHENKALNGALAITRLGHTRQLAINDDVPKRADSSSDPRCPENIHEKDPDTKLDCHLAKLAESGSYRRAKLQADPSRLARVGAGGARTNSKADADQTAAGPNGNKAFGFAKNTNATGPGARGIGDVAAQQAYKQVEAFSQSWTNNQTQGGPLGGGKKTSIYADVKRLQIQAKKFLDASKFEQAKQLIEKALRQYAHDDAVLHF